METGWETKVGLSDPHCLADFQSWQPGLEAPLGGSCHTHMIVSMILENRRAGFLPDCPQGSDLRMPSLWWPPLGHILVV